MMFHRSRQVNSQLEGDESSTNDDYENRPAFHHIPAFQLHKKHGRRGDLNTAPQPSPAFSLKGLQPDEPELEDVEDVSRLSQEFGFFNTESPTDKPTGEVIYKFSKPSRSPGAYARKGSGGRHRVNNITHHAHNRFFESYRKQHQQEHRQTKERQAQPVAREDYTEHRDSDSRSGFVGKIDSWDRTVPKMVQMEAEKYATSRPSSSRSSSRPTSSRGRTLSSSGSDRSDRSSQGSRPTSASSILEFERPVAYLMEEEEGHEILHSHSYNHTTKTRKKKKKKKKGARVDVRELGRSTDAFRMHSPNTRPSNSGNNSREGLSGGPVVVQRVSAMFTAAGEDTTVSTEMSSPYRYTHKAQFSPPTMTLESNVSGMESKRKPRVQSASRSRIAQDRPPSRQRPTDFDSPDFGDWASLISIKAPDGLGRSVSHKEFESRHKYM